MDTHYVIIFANDPGHDGSMRQEHSMSEQQKYLHVE
jgi:hypothetical protein